MDLGRKPRIESTGVGFSSTALTVKNHTYHQQDIQTPRSGLCPILFFSIWNEIQCLEVGGHLGAHGHQTSGERCSGEAGVRPES